MANYTVLINYLSNDGYGIILQAATPVSLASGSTFTATDYSGALADYTYNHASMTSNVFDTAFTSFTVTQNVNVYFFYEGTKYNPIDVSVSSSYSTTVGPTDVLVVKPTGSGCCRITVSYKTQSTYISGKMYISTSNSINTKTGLPTSTRGITTIPASEYQTEWDDYSIYRTSYYYIFKPDNYTAGSYINNVTVNIKIEYCSANVVYDASDWINSDDNSYVNYSITQVNGQYTSIFMNTEERGTHILVSGFSYNTSSSTFAYLYEDGEVVATSAASSWTLTAGHIRYSLDANTQYELRLVNYSTSSISNCKIYKCIEVDFDTELEEYVRLDNQASDLHLQEYYRSDTQTFYPPQGPYTVGVGWYICPGQYVAFKVDDKLAPVGQYYTFGGIQARHIYSNGTGYINEIWSTNREGYFYMQRPSSLIGSTNYSRTQLYTLWTLNSGYFDWDNAKVSGQACNLTANEWNRLRTYAFGRKGYNKNWTTVSSGAILTAEMYNIAAETIGISNRVTQGDAITAALLNALKDAVNS